MKDTSFNSNFSLNIQGILREFNQPLVMGIINTTPDSFYSDSRAMNSNDAIALAEKMIDEKADILDIGGYSSRPGASDISEDEELARVIPVIKRIRELDKSILISIDTFRTRVAEEAILNGANIINDISGGQVDEAIFNIAARYKCPYIMMHMRGNPKTMVNLNTYENLMEDLIDFFKRQIKKAQIAGIMDIIIDPGFGFSKNIDQNFELLNKLELFQTLNRPVLIGISRKSMIYKTLGITADESLTGTTVLNTIAIMNGAKILRVHDVNAAKETIKLISKIIAR